MKITLDASIKEHREIAELFKNQPCEFNRAISGDLMGGAFVSTMNSPHYPKFVVYRLGDVTTKESITIDPDQAKMDLRMAIGMGIEFIAICHESEEVGCVEIGPIDSLDVCGEIIINGEILAPDELKLCPDYLKSVGVEVEE